MRFFALILFGLIAISFAEDSSYETDSYYSYDWDSLEESIEERILGGSVVTDIKQYSYQCGVINVKSETIERVGYSLSYSWSLGQCGGSIIHPKVVLTAAHCVENPKYVAVFHGTTVQVTQPTSPGTIRVEAINVKSHKDYRNDKNGIINDIAIINLPESIIKEGDLYTSVIPLASSTWTSCDGEGETSGWGLIDTTVSTNQLRSVNVTTLAYDSCKWSYSRLVKDQHLCIDGSEFKGTCSGDSGGPFVQFRANGERYLCGVTSFGIGGIGDTYRDAQNNEVVKCRNNKPKVFTLVSHFHDNQWICENSNRLVGCDNGGGNGGNSFEDSSSEEYNNNDNNNGNTGGDYSYWQNGVFYSYKNGVLYCFINGAWYYFQNGSLYPAYRR